jgi:flavodoxin
VSRIQRRCSVKVVVAYVSRTGNTKKVAESIYEGIDGEKEILRTEEIDDLRGYDLIFFGFPIEGYGPPGEAKDFLEKHCEGKKVALFVTHAAPEGYELLKEWLANCWQAAARSAVAGTFNCQGDLSDDMRQKMLKHDDPMVRYWAEVSEPKGNPDPRRLERARVFAKEMIQKMF